MTPNARGIGTILKSWLFFGMGISVELEMAILETETWLSHFYFYDAQQVKFNIEIRLGDLKLAGIFNRVLRFSSFR